MTRLFYTATRLQIDALLNSIIPFPRILGGVTTVFISTDTRKKDKMALNQVFETVAVM
jgi:hypothetical protein